MSLNLVTSGLSTPEGMVVVGNTLYVADAGSNTIDTFNATTGVQISSSSGFISGLDHPISLALDGNTLFVANSFAGTVGAYNITTGNPIGANGASFITVPGESWGLAVSGNKLYVSDVLSQNVGLYSAIDGSVINANFVSTSGYGPEGIAVTAIPEPASAALLTLAVPTLLGVVRRRKSRPVPSH
jgi:DNA-binding beta-propeller fold protein YncE